MAEAALKVIEERGIERLTHRAVAEVAGVPLGSTTYYFKGKDDLLASAIALAEQRNTELLGKLLGSFVEQSDLAAGMAALTEELTLRQRSQLLLDYELYLAARHRPAVRQQSARWAEATMEVIAPQTDALTAQALAYAFEGMLVRSIVLDLPFPADDVEPVFRRIIAG